MVSHTLSTENGAGLTGQIVGVGSTGWGTFPDRTPLQLASAAFRDALADANLTAADIDGLIAHPAVSSTADVDELVWSWGLELTYAHQVWGHGWWTGTLLWEAVAAVTLGQARRVAIIYNTSDTNADVGFRNSLGIPHGIMGEGLRDTGGTCGEFIPFGLTGPVFGSALMVSRYFEKYGYTSADLAEVAVSLRQNATLNPGASHREPIDIDTHQSSPWVVEPLRLYDCCRISDGAACVIVQAADETSDDHLGRPGVQVTAANGLQLGGDQFVFGTRALGAWFRTGRDGAKQHTADQALFARAGVTRDDIDGLYTYDAFTPLIPMALEKYGFCGEGEGLRYIASEGMTVGDKLPVNSHGGLHSEGHSSAWGAIVEMVRQLRHECGQRQIDDAQTLMWAPLFGNSLVMKSIS